MPSSFATKHLQQEFSLQGFSQKWRYQVLVIFPDRGFQHYYDNWLEPENSVLYSEYLCQSFLSSQIINGDLTPSKFGFNVLVLWIWAHTFSRCGLSLLLLNHWIPIYPIIMVSSSLWPYSNFQVGEHGWLKMRNISLIPLQRYLKRRKKTILTSYWENHQDLRVRKRS